MTNTDKLLKLLNASRKKRGAQQLTREQLEKLRRDELTIDLTPVVPLSNTPDQLLNIILKK